MIQENVTHAEYHQRKIGVVSKSILDLIDRWNDKRGFSPPVEIGMGVHRGEVF